MEPIAAALDARPSAGDEELIGRAARGEVRAFETLVRTRTEHAFRTACAILGNESDARDATQDAFIAVWRELPRLRQADRFDAWLGRILVNACRARIRARGRIREISLDALPDRLDSGPAAGEEAGAIEVLGRAFDRLNPDQRALLVLHHLRHEPVARIASAVGIPTGTVKWRLHAARGALQRALRAEGEEHQ